MTAQLVRVDVDTQVGFCDEQLGGLPVKGGYEASLVVEKLNKEAVEKRFLLIGSVDAHTPKDPEFAQYGGTWPVHCVKGTMDQLKMRWTLPDDYEFVPMISEGSARREEPVTAYEPKGLLKRLEGGTAFYFEKRVYSLFDNIAAVYLVKHLAERPRVFEVYGVATDYCVKAAALGLKKYAPNSEVRLLLYACAGVAADSTAAALAEMRDAGIVIVDRATILDAGKS